MSETSTATTPQQTGTQGAGSDLEIKGVTKRFGDFVAVDDLTLTVPQG